MATLNNPLVDIIYVVVMRCKYLLKATGYGALISC